MTAALIVDGLIVLAVLAALLSGWRNGALAAVLSAIGVGAGLVVGIAVAPSVLRTVDEPSLRLLLLVGILVLLVGIGQIIGSSLGTSVRDRMKARSTQRVDSLFGAVFQSFIALIVIWMISIPVATNLGGSAGQGLRDSRILSNLNAAAPPRLASLPNGVAALLNESGLPPLVSPWEKSISGEDVEDPAPDVQDPELVRSIRPSIIHVLGDAEECSRRLLGSGFVVDNDYVVTNAHVVAGTQTVRLDTKLGLKDATVVYYNPEVDIAVLHAPDLGIQPLPWAQQPAQTGDDAIVMGFPHSGPFNAEMARVRDRITIAGPDIYSQGRVERDSYTVRGNIQQGNSGGPLVNTAGEVLGVIFGASVDDSETGYALTADEVIGHIGDVTQLQRPVETGECVAH